MGAGGLMLKAQEAGRDVVRRVPTEKPPFTVGQLKKAVPPHCFQRSAIRSSSYLAYDLTAVSALLYLALYLIPNLPSPYNLLAWPLYWICQGFAATAVWLVAHECSHHAFSDYQLLDDAVGFLLHSSMLIPYFSWKYSHRRHHSNICSLELDEVYVPKPKSSLPRLANYLNNPLGRFACLFLTLTFGFPLYLAFNISGRAYPRFACHYDPYSPIYSDRERVQVVASDAGVIAALYVLFRLAAAYSVGWLIRVYGVPMLIMGGWVVAITYLQHTHPALPRYDSSEWDWLMGTLATVDRDFGGFLNRVFHNATDTHVVHHLFPTMPHYHAVEATRAIGPVLGEYYRRDATPVWKAVWRENRECVYVEAEEEKGRRVYWYNKL